MGYHLISSKSLVCMCREFQISNKNLFLQCFVIVYILFITTHSKVSETIDWYHMLPNHLAYDA